ncbi:uncharacterized protein LOC127855254 isoform X2 [Dreissena polymorpha]|nr:uncharacterized protein LOC127855254 isoform X2 [Dreissena polymorpha]
MKELLPEVVIPEDYAGWFKISKGLGFTKPTPHRSIEAIAQIPGEFFLCTTEFNAVVLTEKVGSPHADTHVKSAGIEHESFVRPVVEGEVLRKTEIQSLNQLLLPECERSLNRNNRYLLCIDEKDCELYVSVSQTGLFYEVSDGNFSGDDNCVVQVSDVLDEMVEMPIYVRHILGDPPPISKFYSPSLKLVRVHEEETVMGSTLDPEDVMPFEIQTNSPIRFEMALNTPMLQSCGEYNEAMEMCKTVEKNYVTDMKLAVTFKVKQEEETTENTSEKLEGSDNLAFVADNMDSLTNSAGTTTSVGKESECVDIEANSEFSIQWEPGPSLRNTPEQFDFPEDPDCESIDESVDTEQAMRLNTVLGGHYFNTDVRVDFGHQNDLKHRGNSIKNNNYINVKDMQRLFVTANKIPSKHWGTSSIDKITEGITDFSVRAQNETRVRTSSPEQIIAPPASFSDSLGSLPSTLTTPSTNHVSNVTSLSSTLTGNTFGSNDTQEHDIAVHNKNLLFHAHNAKNDVIQRLHKPYVFTGDVYVCPNSDSSLDSSESGSDVSETSDVSSSTISRGSIAESWGSWERNKFRVVRSKNIKDIPRDVNDIAGLSKSVSINGRTNPLPEITTVSQPRSRSVSDDMIHFEEPSKSSSATSIVTCKVADEMVFSCKDLRLSLEEITRNARKNHVENTWQAFCLERSSSLPVRSNSTKVNRDIDEHSLSWEQLSPRKSESTSNSMLSTPRYSSTYKRTSPKNAVLKKNAKVEKLNLDLDNSLCDKTQLISDSSSEDSLQYSHRSLDSTEEFQAGDNSFACSEHSDMSVINAPEDVLAAIAEMESAVNYAGSCPDSEPENEDSEKNADSLDRERIAFAQKIKIQHEIKRRFGDWNDVAVII